MISNHLRHSFPRATFSSIIVVVIIVVEFGSMFIVVVVAVLFVLLVMEMCGEGLFSSASLGIQSTISKWLN
jgi:hypothetical protein